MKLKGLIDTLERREAVFGLGSYLLLWGDRRASKTFCVNLFSTIVYHYLKGEVLSFGSHSNQTKSTFVPSLGVSECVCVWCVHVCVC